MTTGRLDVANLMLRRLPRELWTRILGLEADDLPFSVVDDGRPRDEGPVFFGSAEEGGEDAVPPHELERRRKAAEEEVMNVPFYEIQDLTVIRASGNSIGVVEEEVGLVGALRVLDVSRAFFFPGLWRADRG